MRARRFILAAFIVMSASGTDPSAHAELIPPPVAPQMSVTVSHTATTTTICADGALRGGTATSPTWTMTSISMRDGVVDGADPWSAGGTTFHHCFTGWKGTVSSVTAVFDYSGVGSDYASTIFGYGTCADGQDDEFEMSQ